MTNPSALPTGWNQFSFGEIARNISEYENNPLEKGLDRCVGLEHIEPGSLHIKRWNPMSTESSFTRKFKKGQVLFGKRRAYQRKVAIAEFDGICSSDILVFEANTEKIVPELLPFIVQDDHFFDFAIGTSSGSLSPRTKWQFLSTYKVSLPPKEEQQKISSLLWAAEDCILKNERFIEEAERAKQVLMRELFSKGIGQVESENSVLRTIPKGWTIVNLGDKDYFELKTGGTPSTKKLEYWNGKIPWLLSGEVNNKRITITEKKITQLGYDNSNATWIPRKSILLALAGQGKTRGTAAITEIELTVNQSIAAIIPKIDKVLPDYLFYKLDSMYEFLRNYSGGSNRGGLSLRSISDISIPIPSILEQQQIASILTHCDNTISNARTNFATTKALKMQLVNQFFSGDVI